MEILYHDKDIVVCVKPPRVLSTDEPGGVPDLVREALGEENIRTVHRLDRGTSGLLVVAKHPHAQERLKGQLHSPDFHRVYLAVCEGVPHPEKGTVDAPLGPVESSLMAQQVRSDGKPARTHYRVVRTVGERSLLQLELETGRTHQIRVHMAHIGHPLTGDFLYGREDHSLISRTALHSHTLAFRHPVTGQPLCFVQPLPADMQHLVPQGIHD